jgi:hypothetical protein
MPPALEFRVVFIFGEEERINDQEGTPRVPIMLWFLT